MMEQDGRPEIRIEDEGRDLIMSIQYRMQGRHKRTML